ncbi:MAG: reverse transcriptase/maturase family protein [Candidatus Poribacteria bacterium]|nr:reverse transcriptase/maturase family protein [Candidatus Poribacteria bacterium]
MKTYNRLFQRICSFENLLSAARKAQRSKRFQTDVARFNFHLEKEVYRLQTELQTQTYRPGAYHEFYVYEPKLRKISAAPYRDRVVHHALCNVVEPIFERTFIYDSYACRKGKGTHKAVHRFTAFSRKNAYVLKCDIKKYFPSIDHDILKTQFRRKIRDAGVLWLMALIVESSNPQEYVREYFQGDDLLTSLNRQRGIPIGNLTSQFFANIYLNGFDHSVKEDLKCRYYIRYVDDFVVLENDKARLHQVKAEMDTYLTQLRLKLHPHKCQVSPVKDGTDFLGYRIFPTHRRLRASSVRRARRRLRRLVQDYEADKITWADVNHSVQSWLGHIKHADTYGLRRAIFSETVFRRS